MSRCLVATHRKHTQEETNMNNRLPRKEATFHARFFVQEGLRSDRGIAYFDVAVFDALETAEKRMSGLMKRYGAYYRIVEKVG